MIIITLTTDFGNKDYFVSAVKAALISEIKKVNIISISHEINPYNITEASYILKNSYKLFPKGTIHIIGVDSELNKENKHLAIFYDEHYFIGSDNGIFSLVFDGKTPQNIYEIKNPNIPEDIQILINNGEVGLVLLRLVEIIGEDKIIDIDSETFYFIVTILNQLDLDKIRNKLLLKVLPLKV